MFVLLLVLLASPINAGYLTYVSVNYTLICQYPEPYSYTLKLMEEDDLSKNDEIARVSEMATAQMHLGYIGGYDTGDPPTPSYEFFLEVEHNCGSNLQPRKKRLDLESCDVSEKYCDYDMVWIDLE